MQRDIALVVDDHQDTCLILGEYLRLLGYKVETLQSFDSALERIRLDHLCAAFVDLRVPGSMSAEEFIRAVRIVNPDLRIVVISAVHNVAKVAKEIGADAALTKPFDLEALLNELEKHCPKQAAKAS